MIQKPMALVITLLLMVPSAAIPRGVQAATTTPIGGGICQPASASPRPIAAQAKGSKQRTRVVRGAEAEQQIVKMRMRNLRFHNALEDGAKQLIDIGAKRVEAMVVTIEKEATPQRKNLRERLWNVVFPTLHAQDIWTDDGVAFVTTWDDGNITNWEGQIYSIDWESGAEYNNVTQFDIQWQPWVMWSWGGETRRPRNQEASVTEPDLFSILPVANNNSQVCNAACVDRGTGNWGKCALQRSLDDVWNNGACNGLMYGCTSAGLASGVGGYFACLAFGCTGAIFVNYTKNMRDFQRQCAKS